MTQTASNTRDRLSELCVGDVETVVREITAEDVAAFARLSGDYNALHVDDEFAARTEFQQRVVHGFLHASILSTLVGMKLPGPGALYLSQTLDFTRAVFIGDRVEARGTVVKINPETRIIGVRTEIFNQRGERVLDGMAQVKVLRLAEPQAAAAIPGHPAMSELLAGKAALVTGASRGIGQAVARTLAAHGAKVWVNYNRSESAARAVVEEIAQAGGRAEAVKGDVRDEEAVRDMMAQVLGGGGLDILVNNAGSHIVSAPFEKQRWQDMAGAYEMIVGSVFRVTQAALPALEKDGGKIVNVLTSAALGRTTHNWLPYVAAKSALIGLSKNLAQELGPRGITVNMVSPSLVPTDLVASTPDRIRQMMVGRTPLRRLATTNDVAGAVLMLVSPYADFITGDNLLVTGGEAMS